MTGQIRVAVVEEHEVFRRGLVASLRDHAGIHVEDAPGADADVAVVSGRAAGRDRFSCPIVVCAAEQDRPQRPAQGNVIAGVLVRATLTEAQLYATVCAVAAGLRVSADDEDQPAPEALDARAVRVADLLSHGCSTREIADDMGYSERTIKKLIHGLERELKARSRAQVVAQAIRLGVI